MGAEMTPCAQCGTALPAAQLEFDQAGRRVCNDCNAKASAALEQGVQSLDLKLKGATLLGAAASGLFLALLFGLGVPLPVVIAPIVLGLTGLVMAISARNRAIGGALGGAKKLLAGSYVLSLLALVVGVALVVWAFLLDQPA